MLLFFYQIYNISELDKLICNSIRPILRQNYVNDMIPILLKNTGNIVNNKIFYLYSLL